MDPLNDPSIKQIKVAQQNMIQLVNRIVKSCEAKCLGHHFGTAELEIPEASCTDRCVVKYIQVYKKVNERLGLPTV